jgi:hypothetical protein
MIICESRAEFQRQVVAQIAALQRHARLGIQAPVAKERVTHQQLTGLKRNEKYLFQQLGPDVQARVVLQCERLLPPRT